MTPQESLTCYPVKLAMKFYHDQVVYLPADMNCGSKVEIPRSCPIVHTLAEPTTQAVIQRAYFGDSVARIDLTLSMIRNGLGLDQIVQVEHDSRILDQCSNRAKPGDHNPSLLRRHKHRKYPPNMYSHVQAVKAYQQRDRGHMLPNVFYIDVDFGCGGPFSAQCLYGWGAIQLLTHRLHLWADKTIHPKPCNNECLAGWSGHHLDAYRRQTWAGAMAFPMGWRDPDYYTTAAQNILFEQSKYAQQSWGVLDYSHIYERHIDQWEEVGVNRIPVHISWLLSEEQLKHAKIPEHVRVPVPKLLKQIFSYEPEAAHDPETAAAETPEMAEKRIRRAWDRIREKIRRDHPTGKGDVVVVVVQEGEILPFSSFLSTKARPSSLIHSE